MGRLLDIFPQDTGWCGIRVVCRRTHAHHADDRIAPEGVGAAVPTRLSWVPRPQAGVQVDRGGGGAGGRGRAEGTDGTLVLRGRVGYGVGTESGHDSRSRERERKEKMPAAGGAEDSGTYLFFLSRFVVVCGLTDRGWAACDLIPFGRGLDLWRWSWAAQSLKPARWISMGWAGPRLSFVVVIVKWLRSFAWPSEAGAC